MFTIHRGDSQAASPVEALLERIDKGASGKFIIEQIKSPVDFSNWIRKETKSSSVEITR